jgi:hypothetical protein
MALIALGALASTSTISLVSAAGLAVVLAGLLLVAVGTGRRFALALAIIAITAGAALASADFIPFLRSRLFAWLEKTALPSLAKHPAEWAILVVFVLLPPLWSIVGILSGLTRTRKTRNGAAPSAPTPDAAPAAIGETTEGHSPSPAWTTGSARSVKRQINP